MSAVEYKTFKISATEFLTCLELFVLANESESK